MNYYTLWRQFFFAPALLAMMLFWPNLAVATAPLSDVHARRTGEEEERRSGKETPPATKGICELPDHRVDLLFLLPNTLGQSSALDPSLYTELSYIASQVRMRVKGLRVALATYNDQPYRFSGGGGNSTSDQYCFRLEASFNDPEEKFITKLFESYTDTKSRKYSDANPDSKDFIGALVRVTFDESIGWGNPPDGSGWSHYHWITVVFTDGWLRLPNDGLSTPEAATELVPNDGWRDYDCGVEDFFTVSQGDEVLLGGAIIRFIVVSPSSFSNKYEALMASLDVHSREVLGYDTTDDIRNDLLERIMVVAGCPWAPDPAAEAAPLPFLAQNSSAKVAHG